MWCFTSSAQNMTIDPALDLSIRTSHFLAAMSGTRNRMKHTYLHVFNWNLGTAPEDKRIGPIAPGNH